MTRVLPAVFVLALSAPAFAQAVDGEGAKQLSENLSRYVGSQAIDKGVLKVSVEGDAYKIAFDFKALAGMLPKQDLLKFDFAPYVLLAKPRSDATWDISGDFTTRASFEINGPQGPQSTQFSVEGGKFAGVYDPELATFASATTLMTGMTMISRDAVQHMEIRTGAGTASMNATKAANGGVDFTMTQTMAGFVEAIDVDDPKSGLKFPLTIKSPELSVNATGKGLRTKPFLDLLAFAVANEDEAKLKANQAQLKSLLLAALPLWERIDGNYGFKDFTVESPVGHFGATELGTSFGSDGIAQNGAINYSIKAAGLTIPQHLVPGWSTALLPTDIDLNFGGANIDLDSMAKKAIEAFDQSESSAGGRLRRHADRRFHGQSAEDGHRPQHGEEPRRGNCTGRRDDVPRHEARGKCDDRYSRLRQDRGKPAGGGEVGAGSRAVFPGSAGDQRVWQDAAGRPVGMDH